MYMYVDIKQTDGQTEYSRAPESGLTYSHSKLYAPYTRLSRPYTQQQHSNEFQNSKNYGNIFFFEMHRYLHVYKTKIKEIKIRTTV